jgi:hypothetical protein
MKKLLIGLVAGLLALGGAANAQVLPTAPVVQSVGNNDVYPIIPGGVEQAGNYYATVAQSAGQTISGGNYDNALIGGDFETGQNLFQRGTTTTLASTTYYVTYGADRWFSWGGTSTPVIATQQTGAADQPLNSGGSYRINKGSLTGVKQICTSQIVESSGVYRFQNNTAEFTFDAKAGAGFSAASSNLAVYVSYGTGTDEGAAYMAYGLNTQGGAGTTAWTGQVNLGGTTGFLIPINTNWVRYGVEVPIPVTATELGVSICYTPVGTGTATDWFEFGKANLTINPAMTTFAGANGAILGSSIGQSKSFARRPSGQEAALQYRYYYRINEVDTAGVVQSPAGDYDTTTTCSIAFPLPSPMRVTPTADLGNLSATTFKIDPTTTPVVLATPFALIQVGNTSTTMGVMSFKTTTETQYIMCTLNSTAAGAGYFGFTAEE